MQFLLTLWLLVSIPLVIGCTMAIHAEGCDVIDVSQGIEGGPPTISVAPQIVVDPRKKAKPP